MREAKERIWATNKLERIAKLNFKLLEAYCNLEGILTNEVFVDLSQLGKLIYRQARDLQQREIHGFETNATVEARRRLAFDCFHSG